MAVTFLSPAGALIGLAVAAPVGALLLRERRAAGTRRALGLEPPPLRALAPSVLAWVVAFGLLAAAAAQPVSRPERSVLERTDAEAYVVFDITRSMLASGAPGQPTRLARALDSAVELRRSLGDVPVGVATFTNRPLPNLFPTADADAFELVVRNAIAVNRPPGTVGGPSTLSTDLGALEGFARENYFGAAATKRLVVLYTDGESRSFSARELVAKLQKGGVELVVVRLWDATERVWREDGTPEPAYLPDRTSLQSIEALAALTTGRRTFGDDEPGALSAVTRGLLGDGPRVPIERAGQTVSLAPYAVLAACIPLAFLLLPGLLPATGHLRQLAYSMLRACRGSSRTVASRSRRAPASPRRS
jgi:hypothetical protein